MDDIEITKKCAEAMEPPATLPGSSDIWGASISWTPQLGKKVSTWVKRSYSPLHDDAQCMALVKKLNLDISHCSPSGWIVFSGLGDGIDAVSDDLNRAICECVASMGKVG